MASTAKSTPQDSEQPETWFDRIRDLAPLVAQYQDEGQRERRLPQPLVEAMRDAGLYRLWVPREFGGEEVDLLTGQGVIEAMSRLDGSTGWNLANNLGLVAVAAFLPHDGAAEVYAEGPDVALAGSAPPHGRAVVVDGGYRVSGCWPLVSASPQAEWFFCGALIMEGEQPLRRPDGQPHRLWTCFPARDARILDTWQTGGLRATGSHDIIAEDVFVPDRRTFEAASFTPSSLREGVLYRAGIAPLFFPNIAAVALGIARAAIETFVDFSRDKKPLFSPSTLSDQQLVQNHLGVAEARVRSGRSFFYEVLRACWAQMGDGSAEPLSPDLRALMSLADSNAAQSAVEAVDIIYRLAGSSSIYASTRIQRCFQDVNLITQHVAASSRGFTAGGRYLLGLP
jgi:indole-3-acetate monooxygenase